MLKWQIIPQGAVLQLLSGQAKSLYPKVMDNDIRFVEKEILDKEYTRFNILYRGRNLAISHLLKIAGDFWRDEGRLQHTDKLPGTIRLTDILSGLSHCIRWISLAKKKKKRLPNATWYELDHEALDLLVWGMKYHSLSIDHVLWSRKLIQANIDTAARVITFSPFSDFDKVFLISQHWDHQRTLEELYHNLPIKQLNRDFQLWRQQLRVVDGGFDFAEDLVRQLASYPQVINWLEASVLPEVEASQDLGGYSLNEFHRFFAALFLNCNFWTQVEDSFDEEFGAEHNLGTSVLTLPKSAMLGWLHHMSGVRIKAVHKIVAALAFDASHLHTTLMDQPFIETPDKQLFFLPRLISFTNPNRLLVGAMNKGTGRQTYDRLVEKLSGTMLSKIASIFRDLGLEVWQEIRIKNDIGRFITPDLIVLDRSVGELLVADYKHSLSPIGPAQVINKWNEFQKGFKQVQDYSSAMRNLTNWPDRIQPMQVNETMSLLIFGYPMAIPIHPHPEVAVVNTFSLCKQLTQQQFTTLSELVRWAKIRPEFHFPPEVFEEQELTVRVSEWTYKKSVYAIQ